MFIQLKITYFTKAHIIVILVTIICFFLWFEMGSKRGDSVQIYLLPPARWHFSHKIVAQFSAPTCVFCGIAYILLSTWQGWGGGCLFKGKIET